MGGGAGPFGRGMRVEERHARAPLARWLPPGGGLHVLELGCGEGQDAGLLLADPRVVEYIGVDLDEDAVARARARWPAATFLCADAAALPAGLAGRFDLVFVGRPDLLAQPERWRRAFAALPGLLGPAGRALVTLTGPAETALARRWLRDGGLREVHAPSDEGGSWVVVAEREPAPVLRDEGGEACDVGGWCGPGETVEDEGAG